MPKATKINRIAFVIDRSGSMRPIMSQAVSAFNDNLRAIKEQAQETGQDATITLITFDDTVETLAANRPVTAFKGLKDDAILPGGSTALFDATARAIEEMRDMPVGKDDDVSYLVNVITDGAENASVTTAAQLKKLMASVQKTDRWTLTFLVPRGGQGELSRFGIPDGNIMEWSPTAAGVKKYAEANKAGIASYFRARAAGQRSVKSFYTDLSAVAPRDIRQLDDLSARAKVLTVKRDSQIRDFIEGCGLTFVKGSAFYQLVPGKETADKVQDYKKVLIVEKGTSKVYGGDDARRLLGLPDTVTKVRPGDHGNFDIFIQSTSVNRKVQGGTKVIYMPSAVT